MMREKRSDRGRLSQTGREEKSAISVSKHHSANVTNAPRQVRIIGGAWKRTPLPVANAVGLRPTPDRVRETLFNWLAHLMPEMDVVRGLDLCRHRSAGLRTRFARRPEGHAGRAGPVLLFAAGPVKQKLSATQVELVPGDALAIGPALAGRLIRAGVPRSAIRFPLLLPALAEAARSLVPAD
jgi:hypothetical protein